MKGNALMQQADHGSIIKSLKFMRSIRWLCWVSFFAFLYCEARSNGREWDLDQTAMVLFFGCWLLLYAGGAAFKCPSCGRTFNRRPGGRLLAGFTKACRNCGISLEKAVAEQASASQSMAVAQTAFKRLFERM